MSTSDTYKVLRLDAKNYPSWKVQITSVLKAKLLYKYCQSEIYTPSDDNIMAKNEAAKSIMLTAMDVSLISAYGDCRSAYQMWNMIQQTYQGTDLDYKNNLLKDFFSIKLNNDNISSYTTRFLELTGQLASIDYRIEEDTKICIYMQGLAGSKHHSKAETWLIANRSGQLSQLISIMRSNEKEEEKKETTALVSEDKKMKKCNHCNKSGHLWKECYARLRKLNGNKNRAAKPSPNTGYKNKQGSQRKVFSLDEPEVLMALTNNQSLDENDWVVDSGATSHMTPNKSWLSNIEMFQSPTDVRLGGDKPLKAVGKGDLITPNIKLANVLWVPNLRYNLFSVSTASDNGCQVLFSGFNGAPKIVKNNRILMTGTKKGNLFTISLVPNKPENETVLMAGTVEDWHERFGHASTESIQRLIDSKAVKGLHINSKEEQQCEACVHGKACRVPHKTRTPKELPLGVLHFDTVGPITPLSLGKNSYFVLATDQKSGYKFIEFVPTKSTIWSKVMKIISDFECDANQAVKRVYSDQGTEFKNKRLSEWLEGKGIGQYFSVSYTPKQNGLAERSNRTIIDGATTLLLKSKLPANLWAEACNVVVYTSNRLLKSRSEMRTKYELLFGRPPNVGNLRVFGSRVLKINQKHERTKFGAKGSVWKFVGYSDRFNTYKIYNPETKEVRNECDLIFLKNNEASKQAEENSPEKVKEVKVSQQTYDEKQNDYNLTPPSIDIEESNHEQSFSNQTIYSNDSHDFIINYDSPNFKQIEELREEQFNNDNLEMVEFEDILQQRETGTGYGNNNEAAENTRGSKRDESNSRPITPRSHKVRALDEIEAESVLPGKRMESTSRPETPREIKSLKIDVTNPPEIILDLNRPYTRSVSQKKESETALLEGAGDLALISLNNEPNSINEARTRADWSLWKKAIMEELEALMRLEVFELIAPETGVKPIKNRWVFKLKNNTDGTIRYKARLVAKGYLQVENIDYKETFAPTARLTTIRIVLAIAAQYGMQLFHIDVATAFLYGDLEEKVLMDAPEGIETHGKICLLKKSLYGLKQAPRCWNKKFQHFLLHYKLKQSETDECLYFNEKRTLLVAIYVDDGLIASANLELLNNLMVYLKENLSIKTELARNYLGIEITQNINLFEPGTVIINQPKYIDSILSRFNMQNCNECTTPETASATSIDTTILDENTPFKEAIGSLMYLMVCCRPDICHALAAASRTDKPTMHHWQLIKRIFRYLKGTKELGITFKGGKDLQLSLYVDADHANCPDTRRSTTGYVVKLNSAPIVWGSPRQSCVTLSTTESEYIAGCDAAKHLLPIRYILRELNVIGKGPTNVYIDNSSAVRLAVNEKSQQRTRHIHKRQKWLTELHNNKTIDVKHVPKEKQEADIFTKPLGTQKFLTMRNLLMPLCLMTLICTVVNAASFSPEKLMRKVSPVSYRRSDVQFFTGAKSMNVRLTIVNPCQTFFTNIINDDVIEKRLIEECNNEFNNYVKLRKTFCPQELNSTSVAMLSNIHTFGDSNRPRRNPAAVGIGMVMAINTGLTVYNTYQINVLQDNVNQLLKQNNEKNEMMKQAFNILETTKETIQSIDDKVNLLERKIDFIDKKVQSFPKILALVNEYDNMFHSFNEILSDIATEANKRKMSAKIMTLTNLTLWDEPAADWSRLHKCAYSYDKLNNNFESSFWFTIPISVKNVRIVESNSFKFWNRTASNSLCLEKYVGPETIMVNITNNCYLEVHEHWVEDKVVKGKICAEPNSKIEFNHRLFIPEICTETPDYKSTIQMRERDESNLIYCYGNNITIRSETLQCPEHVFAISVSEPFDLNNYQHKIAPDTEVTVNPLDRKINRDINEQLGTSNLIIKPANLTSLNSKLNSLNEIIKKANNLTRIEVPSALQQPISMIARFFLGVWEAIEIGLIIVIAIGIVLIAIISAPLLHVLFVLFNILRKSVSKTVESLPIIKKENHKGNWD